MTSTIVAPHNSAPTTPSAADGVAERVSALATARELRIAAVHYLLTAAWPAHVDQPDPAQLHTIAARLIDSGTPIPAIPTTHAAAQVLDQARRAHANAAAAHQTADDAWHAFRADVRRRAAHAVDADHICLEGTNTALREFGLDELRREYRVELTVSVYVTVQATDETSAYDAAETIAADALSSDSDDVDIDTYDIGHVSAEVTEDSDLD